MLPITAFPSVLQQSCHRSHFYPGTMSSASLTHLITRNQFSPEFPLYAKQPFRPSPKVSKQTRDTQSVGLKCPSSCYTSQFGPSDHSSHLTCFFAVVVWQENKTEQRFQLIPRFLCIRTQKINKGHHHQAFISCPFLCEQPLQETKFSPKNQHQKKKMAINSGSCPCSY